MRDKEELRSHTILTRCSSFWPFAALVYLSGREAGMQSRRSGSAGASCIPIHCAKIRVSRSWRTSSDEFNEVLRRVKAAQCLQSRAIALCDFDCEIAPVRYERKNFRRPTSESDFMRPKFLKDTAFWIRALTVLAIVFGVNLIIEFGVLTSVSSLYCATCSSDRTGFCVVRFPGLPVQSGRAWW